MEIEAFVSASQSLSNECEEIGKITGSCGSDLRVLILTTIMISLMKLLHTNIRQPTSKRSIPISLSVCVIHQHGSDYRTAGRRRLTVKINGA